MKIIVKKPTEKELEELGVAHWKPWSCEVSTFDWTYAEKEIAYILNGRVRVRTPRSEVRFGVGDLVTFPKGLSCTWIVEKPVRKVYRFE
ncbi:MAG: cupin domain-containing protein [Candidatus Omnitrophica bacterium]|nr:cupin domain-containing protein [Candidatus Omnitrophota bacterium]